MEFARQDRRTRCGSWAGQGSWCLPAGDQLTIDVDSTLIRTMVGKQGDSPIYKRTPASGCRLFGAIGGTSHSVITNQPNADVAERESQQRQLARTESVSRGLPTDPDPKSQDRVLGSLRVRPVHDSSQPMERNRGLRRVFLKAPVYRAAQQLIAGPHAARRVVTEIIAPRSTDVVVDIGCGTADIAELLQCGRYVGFDPNPPYIEQAQRRLVGAPNARAEVFISGVGEPALRERLPERADVVIMMGVLHHLDDALALEALRLAATLTKSTGRFVSLDPAFVEGQSLIARELARRDRGSHVRTLEQMRALVTQAFTEVDITAHHDLLRVPYSHVSVQASRPANHQAATA